MTQQEIYVVIEFDRETHEFSEIEAIYQSKEEAENLVKKYNAKFLRYSYEWFEETYHAEEVDAVLAEKDKQIAELKEKYNELAKLHDKAIQACCDADKVIAHHKYKRCLAMSECREAQALWCYQAANTLPPGVTATLNGKLVMVEPRQLFKRSERLLLASGLWKRRSEKFKEAK